MTATAAPRPYHHGRFAPTSRPAEPRIAAEWAEPQYPGDSIASIRLTRKSELGDVRVQWYGDGNLKVGAFLPGVVECSPGDTPKVWPDHWTWATDKPAAAKVLVQYVIDALRDGWRIK